MVSIFDVLYYIFIDANTSKSTRVSKSIWSRYHKLIGQICCENIQICPFVFVKYKHESCKWNFVAFLILIYRRVQS